MIKQNKDGELIFIQPQKILQEIKFLHQELPSFVYSWAWEAKCVNALEKDDWLEQISELKVKFDSFIKAAGFVKRCEVYARKPFQIGKRLFNVRLVSYGSSNRKKMHIGPNQLAHAFDKLLFDYVFAFLETPKQTAKKIQLLIERAEMRENYLQLEQLKQSQKELLGQE
ncbi:hypothetical protein pb186bvf_020790 [Paramecium bursaria]